MAAPVYQDNGGISAATGQASIDVNWPATVNNNDIILAALLDADNDTFSTPTDWTKITELTNANFSVAFFWYRADGTETGTETFTSGSSSGNTIAGVMSRYSGCKTTGTPYEDPGTDGITLSNTIGVPAVTTTGIERLLVAQSLVEDDTTITGGTSGYTVAFNLTSAVGDDCRIAMQYQEVLTAQTIAAGTATLGASEYWGTLNLALLPTSTDDDLTAQNVASGNVVISQSGIGQEHSFTSQIIESGNVSISNPSIGQEHGLNSQNVTSGIPIISQPTLTDVAGVDNLISQNILSGNTVISQPVLTDVAGVNNLVSQNTESGNVIISQPSIGQIQDLVSQSVLSGNVSISNPILNDFLPGGFRSQIIRIEYRSD
jgi:hypothetical protein